MRTMDSARTKETPGVIFDLYRRVMEKFAPVAISPVFDSGGYDFTVVIVKKPSTEDHDLWIYHFPYREAPVGKITKHGEYLTMSTYDSPNGARMQVTEAQVVTLLSNLITAIEARRDQVSILDVGLPYDKRI